MSVKIIWNFYEAAKKGDIETIREHLKRHPDEGDGDIDYGYWGYTALMYACQAGQLEVVEELLSTGYDNNNENGSALYFYLNRKWGGHSALSLACENGHVEVVRRLLQEKEIAINNADGIGTTPLIRASRNGHFEVVRELLQDKRTNYNFQDDLGNNALIYACEGNHNETVKELLKMPDIELHAKHTSKTAFEVTTDKNIRAMLLQKDKQQKKTKLPTLPKDKSGKNEK